jgi:hypothetical protein
MGVSVFDPAGDMRGYLRTPQGGWQNYIVERRRAESDARIAWIKAQPKPLTAEEVDAAQATAVGEIDFLKINREFS